MKKLLILIIICFLGIFCLCTLGGVIIIGKFDTFINHFFNESICSKDILEEVYSPSGEQKAIFYATNCGALSSYTYSKVSVIPAGVKFPEEPNIYSGASFYAKIKLLWEEENELHLFIRERKEPIFKKDVYQNIKIVYHEFSEFEKFQQENLGTNNT